MALPIIHRDHIHDQEMFEAFGCKVPNLNPATPDRLEPDVVFHRKFAQEDLEMPDGTKVPMWLFFDPVTGARFPNETIRVREGQTYHTILEPSVRVHTIHHHGVEPTPFNDGVGHTSFEVPGRYVYQRRASRSGTFFYHCHVNTVLHFEMGLYGMLIVDPPTGPGTVRRMNDIIPYDVEAVWAADEIDPTWHTKKHAAGLACPNGEDEGLNNFNPTFFLISGVPNPNTRTHPNVAVSAQVGQTVLLRVLCAGYTVQKFTIEGLDAEVIGIDGRTLGEASHSPYSRPFAIPAGTPFDLLSAQRWDLIMRPTAAGSFPAKVEFKHWITGEVLGTAETLINVS